MAKVVYIPNIRTYKIGKRIQKRDLGYWMIVKKEKKQKTAKK